MKALICKNIYERLSKSLNALWVNWWKFLSSTYSILKACSLICKNIYESLSKYLNV